MRIEKLKVGNIPAILWGEKSEKIYIYVHGKMSSKEYAKDFANIAQEKGYQTLSFDLPEHGERIDKAYSCNIWNGIKDLNIIADYVFSRWSGVSLFACSLGAYFSLSSYRDRKFENCLFQSPVLDMEYLINQMFIWFNVTKYDLKNQKVIYTPLDTLAWDYYQYVINNPITVWSSPTSILFGGKDNLQSMELVKRFANEHSCKLTISPESEHPFMDEKDKITIKNWLSQNI